ncbi:hypothetical protein DFP72DRAFT_1014355 [Ephemerocybe angulata]|uniref:DUF6589 domain-containing protein n=1 Tax=Ephemerocybe angulata TaxID=980116 RepID=A0A8H6HPD0_9AGAR|nr:hypothetical protein DFP72DRAFT_1014355 [Tulosesus angulatus]
MSPQPQGRRASLPAASASASSQRSTPPSTSRKRKAKESKTEATLRILHELNNYELTPSKLITAVVTDKELSSYNNTLFSPPNRDSLIRMLDALMEDDKGKVIFREWMRPHAIQLVSDIVSKEMESAKPLLRMKATEVTTDYIEHWDLQSTMSAVTLKTPTWRRILDAATEKGAVKVQTKKSRNRDTVCATVYRVYLLMYLRSAACMKVQLGIGLMAWATGASKQLADVLHHSCLSIPYTTLNTVIASLAESSVNKAKLASKRPYALAYDNINLSSSIYVEQTPGMMSKVQSGTFGVIYELPYATWKDMELAPMMERLKTAKPLTMEDLRPTTKDLEAFTIQTKITIVNILITYVEGLEHLKDDIELKRPVQRATHPDKFTNTYHPLRVSTIEEASVEGNLHVHQDLLITQLEKAIEDLSKYAVPSDVNGWTRREFLQLAFGVFHLVMNLLWGILENYRGSVAQLGSLSHFFALLEKVRLGKEHPDYHTLLQALTQVIHGLILNAWAIIAKGENKRTPSNDSHPDVLAEIAKFLKRDNPTAAELLAHAQTIVDQFTPDHVFNNTMLLTRDLLYVLELVNAVSSGDWGRIECILPTLACMFRGVGSNNYSMEVLHLLHSLKHVWTPEFA